MKREFELKLSGNEACNTNSLILLVQNMLCSKFLCQNFLIEFPSYENTLASYENTLPARLLVPTLVPRGLPFNISPTLESS